MAGYDLTQAEKQADPESQKRIRVVFQDFKLLPDRTIDENLKFVLKSTGWKNKKEIGDRIDKVLKMVGITLNKNKYPFELSGGEQQRVAIARALLNEPKLIIVTNLLEILIPRLAKKSCSYSNHFMKRE